MRGISRQRGSKLVKFVVIFRLKKNTSASRLFKKVFPEIGEISIRKLVNFHSHNSLARGILYPFFNLNLYLLFFFLFLKLSSFSRIMVPMFIILIFLNILEFLESFLNKFTLIFSFFLASFVNDGVITVFHHMLCPIGLQLPGNHRPFFSHFGHKSQQLLLFLFRPLIFVSWRFLVIKPSFPALFRRDK